MCYFFLIKDKDDFTTLWITVIKSYANASLVVFISLAVLVDSQWLYDVFVQCMLGIVMREQRKPENDIKLSIVSNLTVSYRMHAQLWHIVYWYLFYCFFILLFCMFLTNPPLVPCKWLSISFSQTAKDLCIVLCIKLWDSTNPNCHVLQLNILYRRCGLREWCVCIKSKV